MHPTVGIGEMTYVRTSWLPPKPGENVLGWLIRYKRDHLEGTDQERSRKAISARLGMNYQRLEKIELGKQDPRAGELLALERELGLKPRSIWLARQADFVRERQAAGHRIGIQADTSGELRELRQSLGWDEGPTATRLGVDLHLYQAWEAGLATPGEILHELTQIASGLNRGPGDPPEEHEGVVPEPPASERRAQGRQRRDDS